MRNSGLRETRYYGHVFKRTIIVVATLVSAIFVFAKPSEAATYTGCSEWRTVSNPFTGQAITAGSNQRYANLNSMNLSCADLSGIDFYGAVIGGVDWTNSNLSNTTFGGTSYCGGVFTGADVLGSNIKSTSTWSCASRVDVYTSPTTTVATTAPPTTAATTSTVLSVTTTTVVTPSNYCLKYGGLGLSVRWINSKDLNWDYKLTPFPGVQLFTLLDWLNKTDQQKFDLAIKEVAVRPIPDSGCSSLNETLFATTSTTTSTSSTPPTVATTIAPNSNSVPSSGTVTTSTVSNIPGVNTTTTVASISNSVPNSALPTTTSVSPKSVTTTTTAAVKKCVPTTDEVFVYSYFQTGNVTNHGGKYDPASYGFDFDYVRKCSVSRISKILIETSYGIDEAVSASVKIDFDKTKSNCWRVARVSDYGQSEWSNKVCYTAPFKGVPTPKASTSVPKGVKGAQCLDGYRTKVRTKKACSTHYGRDFWLYKSFKVGYSNKYKPQRSYARFAVDTGSATGKCVGICYGVPSTVNGLPRNNYVSGYFRKDGTYVRPYTRS